MVVASASSCGRRAPFSRGGSNDSSRVDGAIEGKKSRGGGFGLDRLIDIVGQSAFGQLPAEEIVRHVAKAIFAHHSQRLDDDATLFIVQWSGPT